MRPYTSVRQTRIGWRLEVIDESRPWQHKVVQSALMLEKPTYADKQAILRRAEARDPVAQFHAGGLR